MPIIIETTTKTFNPQSIAKGDVIRAKYDTWDNPINGIVASVTDQEIRVIYIPDIGNVTNYFAILANEVIDGKWTLRWSTDLQTINAEGV